MRVKLEETYPYLLRDAFKDSTFYQLSYGNITTEDLVSQATAYLTHWNPDFIVVQSGLTDCRPEAFTEAQKAVINRLPGSSFFARIKKHVNNPSLIRRRRLTRVSKQSFRKTLKKFKLVFASSKIFWLEVCVGPDYEKERPGILRSMEDYNKIIEEIYGEEAIRLQDKMLEIGGFNGDNTHWLANAHRMVADILISRMNPSPELREGDAIIPAFH